MMTCPLCGVPETQHFHTDPEREYRANHSSLAHSHVPPRQSELRPGAPLELEE